jgi:hypothetical protein
VGTVSHATAAGAGAGAQVARHARVRRVKSLQELARREGVDSSYVSRMVNLTTLAPDIVAVILDDTLPPVLTLFDFAVDPPALWEEQRAGRLSKLVKRRSDEAPQCDMSSSAYWPHNDPPRHVQSLSRSPAGISRWPCRTRQTSMWSSRST